MDRDDVALMAEQRDNRCSIGGAKERLAARIPWQLELLPSMTLQSPDLPQCDVTPLGGELDNRGETTVIFMPGSESEVRPRLALAR